MTEIYIKRIYEPYEPKDGYRILVDRLWPRGISKNEAKLAMWAKEVAPSDKLRKWFGHRSELFDAFRSKYLEELQNDSIKSQQVERICSIASEDIVTLVYAAKDPIHNNAYILKEELLRKLNTY
ncbi:uncharacterized protein YeaO (DUF488 family) [Cytobacillus eiseniae]|uniref:Uncharacterized protein YeaO (DUF488 family) n=1 Tax=Cytobacillus eiseniae TaxID=762947 RepID=A0ABS4RIE9_9BACI|nr:DUF488 domain-containing protein [Cytobacillus eiseniae]MBP2242509.1 uncharacterized protein YeaO (DUF488 family) [Cytobacillus eiseniae]